MWPSVELDDNGIFIETHTDEFVTVNLALFVAEERKRLSGKEKKPLLVLFKKMVGFEPEVRNHTDQILANVSALGFYVNSETQEGKETIKLMEDFYKITPYPVPVKVFDDETAAINWLKQFV